MAEDAPHRPDLSDPFLRHEALDRAHILLDHFERSVATHPFVEADAELKAQADAIAERMAELYQSIGRRDA